MDWGTISTIIAVALAFVWRESAYRKKLQDIIARQVDDEQLIMDIRETQESDHQLWVEYTGQIDIILKKMTGKEAWNRERAEQLLYAWNAARAVQPQIDRIDRTIKQLEESDGLAVQRLDKLESFTGIFPDVITAFDTLTRWRKEEQEGEQGSDELSTQ